MINKKIIFKVLTTIISIALLVFVIFPIFYGFIFSNFNMIDENKVNNASLLIKDYSFKNYVSAFNSGYINSLLFTFLYIIILVLMRLIICGSAGYVLSTNFKKIKKSYIIFLLITASIPENVLLIGLLNLFNKSNVQSIFYDSFILAAPSIFSLFTILIFRNGFLSVSKDEKRCMYIDNLSLTKKINVIFLPKLNLAITLTTIISAATAWNSYLWPSIYLFGKSQQTLSTWVFSIGTLPDGATSQAIRMAGTYLYILPALTIYFLTNKKIIKSFEKI